MAKVQISAAIDQLDIDAAKRCYVKAFRRRPRADAADVTLAVAFAGIYVAMEGLTTALPAETVRSVMLQMVDQAEAVIKAGGL